jgi:hypothetical protein
MDKASGSGGAFTLTKGQLFLQGSAQPIVFAVTSGHCIQLLQDSMCSIAGTTVLSGGTSQAGSYAVIAQSGSKCMFINAAPTLTGGTLNNDIKAESTAAIANSALGSNGTSTLDAVTQAIVMRVAA